MKQKVKKIVSILNIPRGWVLYLLSKSNPKITQDFERWASIWKRTMPPMKSRFMVFNYLMLYYQEFRSVVLARIKEKSYVGYAIGRVLYKPVTNLYINSERIDGGLFIEHGFSTIIMPKHIGKNCWINQQVTIGFTNAVDCPTLGDNVRVCAGAIIVGNVHIGDNTTIGAGAVVVNDIPSNSVAVGVPAKVVHEK